MRTVKQYFNPAMPFSNKRSVFIKLSSDGVMPDHFFIINFYANIE